MQNSDQSKENNKNLDELFIATRSCPRFGDRKIRRSSKKIKDGLLNILLLIPILGALWMNFNQGTDIAGPVETVSNDQIEILAEKGDPDAELQMGLHNTSFARPGCQER